MHHLEAETLDLIALTCLYPCLPGHFSVSALSAVIINRELMCQEKENITDIQWNSSHDTSTSTKLRWIKCYIIWPVFKASETSWFDHLKPTLTVVIMRKRLSRQILSVCDLFFNYVNSRHGGKWATFDEFERPCWRMVINKNHSCFTYVS